MWTSFRGICGWIEVKNTIWQEHSLNFISAVIHVKITQMWLWSCAICFDMWNMSGKKRRSVRKTDIFSALMQNANLGNKKKMAWLRWKDGVVMKKVRKKWNGKMETNFSVHNYQSSWFCFYCRQNIQATINIFWPPIHQNNNTQKKNKKKHMNILKGLQILSQRRHLVETQIFS